MLYKLLYEDFVGYSYELKFRIKVKFTHPFNFKRKVCKALYLRLPADTVSTINRRQFSLTAHIN